MPDDDLEPEEWSDRWREADRQLGPGGAAAPPGWYPDPYTQGGQRWWDGGRWTARTEAVGGRRRRGRRMQVVLGAALVLVLLVVAGIALVVVRGSSHPGVDESAPGGTGASTELTATTGSLPVSPPPGLQILSASGPASRSTAPFTVPANWNVHWSFDCTATGRAGFFGWQVFTKSGASDLVGSHEVQTSGAGLVQYHQAGTFILHVSAVCPWTIRVITG